MLTFILGFLIGFLFVGCVESFVRESKWSKWSMDDFLEDQKIETQKFIVFKREQENG